VSLRVCTPEDFPTGLRCAACRRSIHYSEPYTTQLIELGGECGPGCPPPERCIGHADIAQVVCVDCGASSPIAECSELADVSLAGDLLDPSSGPDSVAPTVEGLTGGGDLLAVSCDQPPALVPGGVQEGLEAGLPRIELEHQDHLLGRIQPQGTDIWMSGADVGDLAVSGSARRVWDHRVNPSAGSGPFCDRCAGPVHVCCVCGLRLCAACATAHVPACSKHLELFGRSGGAR
jgi:hypothetical protein